MLRFFRAKEGDDCQLPEGFEEAYLCDVLGITFTELEKQPSDWVDKILMIKAQRSQAEKLETKVPKTQTQ